MTDSPSQHLLTTTNSTNKAIFTTLPLHPKKNPSPYGWTTHVYASTQLPPDVSHTTNTDLSISAEMSQIGLAKIWPRIIPDNGFSTAMLALNPGAETPMHRTRTVDAGIIFKGQIDMHLDSGEVRTLKQGDTFVQRGTNHKWVNAYDQECQIFAFAIEAKPILGANGEELGESGLQ